MPLAPPDFAPGQGPRAWERLPRLQQASAPFVGWVGTGAVASGVSVTSQQTVMPDGWLQGDLLVLDFVHCGPNTITQNTDLVAAGWTQVAGSPAQPSFGQLWRYVKVAGASESPPNLTFSAGNDVISHITAIRQFDTVDTSASTFDSGVNTTAISSPSVTVVDGAFLLAAYATRVAAPPNPMVITDPDYAEKIETSNTQASGAGATLSFATRGPVILGSYSGDLWAPSSAGTDALIITSVKLGGGVTPISLSDTGAATDSFTAAAAVPLGDSGAGTDGVAVTAAIPLSDTGTGTDSLTVTSPVPLADTGAATDTLTVTAAIQLAEVGAGTDSFTVAAQISLADTGAASDSLVVQQIIPVALADTGTAVDTLTVTAAAPLAETGQATDRVTITAAVPLADVGAASDTIIVQQIIPKPLSDVGAGTDSLVVTVAAALAEVGAAADSIAATVLLSLADTGTGSDTFTVAAAGPFTVGTLTATDSVTGTLTNSIMAGVGAATSSSGQLTATDTTTGTMTATVQAGGPT